MPSHPDRVHRNNPTPVRRTTEYRRRIIVSEPWFEMLEHYLQADERFVDPRDAAWPLILVTPVGKTLEFVRSREGVEPRVYTPEELQKIELVKGLFERGIAEMVRIEDEIMEREFVNATDRRPSGIEGVGGTPGEAGPARRTDET